MGKARNIAVSRRHKARRVTREEAALWRLVTQDVTPLGDRTPAIDADMNDAPEAISDTASLAPPRAKPAARRRGPSPTPIEVGVAAGVDKRTAQRLRRGKMAVEARIDLHGHTVAQAHRALNTFLAASQSVGRRCVLVITGKGTYGEGRIRNEVPHWLNEPGNHHRVLSVSQAHPRDGGSGALYVLLRKGSGG